MDKTSQVNRNVVNEFNRQLDQAGQIARKGQLVDASYVKPPIQRNTPDENSRINKAGEAPDGWTKNKRRQKDTEARWTKKGDKSYFGYLCPWLSAS